MSTDNTVKFSFETEFAADGTVLRNGDSWQLSFSRDEMEKERNEAFAEGQKVALVKAEELSGQHLRALAEHSKKTLSTLSAYRDTYRTQIIDVALVAARKIAGAALERYPDEQVQNMVREVFKDLQEAPRLVVTCPVEVTDKAVKNLQTIADDSGFDGALIVRRVENTEPGDVRLEWAQGEISITTAEIAERVENTVRHWLSATEAHESQNDILAIKDDTQEG